MAAQMTRLAIADEERSDTDSSPNPSLRVDTSSDPPDDDPYEARPEIPSAPSK
jgi:hypothetical protein